LLHSADIGIYPEEDSVISKGKSTMKVMDFLATGLPMIGVPYGLPDEAENGKNMIIVRNDEEWIAAFKLLAGDSALRETLGKNGLQLIHDHYSIAASFEVFLNQILKKNTL
jgi:glycosyltransferase involved in cell wall biosynthesis